MAYGCGVERMCRESDGRGECGLAGKTGPEGPVCHIG